MPIALKYMGSGMSPLQTQVGIGTVENSLTAAGNSQATALQLTLDDMHIVTTAGASTGVIIPPGTGAVPSTYPYQIGDNIIIVNHGANTLSVYPATGGKIANGAANAAFSIPATKTAYFLFIGTSAVPSWAASVSS